MGIDLAKVPWLYPVVSFPMVGFVLASKMEVLNITPSPSSKLEVSPTMLLGIGRRGAIGRPFPLTFPSESFHFVWLTAGSMLSHLIPFTFMESVWWMESRSD